MEDLFKNIWELYGVIDNPFSTQPLLVKGGTLPIECFVGRVENIKRLSKTLSSRGGSRSLIFGDVGVGKTSFVNFVRYKALENGFFTPFKEIAVQDEWAPEDFILNTLSAIYTTLAIIKNPPISKDVFKKLESLLGIESSDTSFGVEAMGFGGNYSKQRKGAQKLTNISIQDFFETIIKDLIEKTGKEVIIHYNNLELLTETKTRKLFNNLRDFFNISGVHFIFIGNLTTHSIIQSMPRVSSIISDTPIHIENLSIDEINNIIRKRFTILGIKDLKQIIPFTEDCLKTIYVLMEGNIRHILNSLSTAVSEATTEKAVVVDSADLTLILKTVLEERYLVNIPNRARDVLLEIVKHKEITNKSLSDTLNIQRSNISQYLKDLEKEGCIYLRRKNGKDKFWSAQHRIKWALLKATKKGQSSLFKFI